MRPRGRETLLEGKVQHHGRFAFLLAEDAGGEDLMLRGPSLRLAMDGDRVVARVVPGEKGRPAGEIVKVVSRARDTVSGILRRAENGWNVVPEDADERDGVRVLGFVDEVAPRTGEAVVIRITRFPSFREPAGGVVCESLGVPGEPGVRLRLILRSLGLPESFPEEVLAEGGALPEAPSAGEKRLDLRGLPLFTIDGADAKDFDDAVSLEVIDRTRVRLGVHIADVAQYVEKGSALDKEAARRATSVYLADRVVPMLPPRLSEDLCSLRPDADRLAVSCFLELDAAGKVHSASLAESVIRSRRRFTYEEAQAVLDGRELAALDGGVRDSLRRMDAVFKAVRLQRLRRGALELSSPEYEVMMDSGGRPLDVAKRPRLDSHRLIEEFMVLANEAVARELRKRRLAFLSRIHPDPDLRRLEGLGAHLKKMGLYVPAALSTEPALALQTLLRNVEGHALAETVHMLVARSLKQARYSEVQGSHFGLASAAYCHFTSPIRRYPDLLVHRVLKASLRGREDRSLGEGLAGLAEHCSERERAADAAERRCTDILRAELLKGRVGEVFEGVVTGVASFGCFLTLEGFGASGLLRGGAVPLGSRLRVVLEQVDEGSGELLLSLPGAPKSGPREAREEGGRRAEARPPRHGDSRPPRRGDARGGSRSGKPGTRFRKSGPRR